MPNVKLAVRLRPFTERELRSEKDRVPVVNITDANTVTITNIKVSVSGAGDSRERVRRYFADHTFDSACCASDAAYASQEKIFTTIGQSVVTSVQQGTSACVLAYGQSSTGKTHTMMGTEAQPGLVPRICRVLADGTSQITVSFLEIYNEKVHDLLAGEAVPTCNSLPRQRGNCRKDLRVREHPSRGTYVQNLRRVVVLDAASLVSLVNEGSRRRRTAPTRRNPSSSRSHALLEIQTALATLRLADLAGSEKASWEGCGGGRQKEGANINKSLVALSNVISALVGGGKGSGRFVPYRDSALTWLLKDCFTGGASTFIIATLSPSASCYGESASTLRWAARARQLPPPRSSTGNGSRALHVQYTQLLAELARNFITYIPETGKITYDDNHWTLHSTEKDLQLKESNETTIGNIMNILHPKSDAHTSESTASSVASGSSDVINNMDKNAKLTEEISKEVDKLFGPALERTRSGGDLKVIAPIRHKRRQYRSQEVLPLDQAVRLDENKNENTQEKSRSEGGIIETKCEEAKSQIPILYDNQRAEIVASVTERLYSKFKKKEEAAVSKMESLVDKKIMEPLNELKICTNARQRLMDLSHKSLRNKRRIGIPAHTQTRVSVTRVRDQAIDVQNDLLSYMANKRHLFILHRDVATETIPMTPRCKEIGVGSKNGTLNLQDRATITEPKKIQKSTLVMTDTLPTCDTSTQTPIQPPPRRKRRLSALTRYIRNMNNRIMPPEAFAATPVISINISQNCPTESETQSSDDSIEKAVTGIVNSATMTPDLLTNHNTIDSKANSIENVAQEDPLSEPDMSVKSEESTKLLDEFDDTDDYSLPRVTVNTLRKGDQSEIKDIILGRNENLYPYNIVLSPPRERDTKRIVKFKGVDDLSNIEHMSWKQSSEKTDTSSDITHSESEMFRDSDKNTSDATESSKVATEASFVWKTPNTDNRPTCCSKRGYTPINNSNTRYRTAKAKLYREFLGLEVDRVSDTTQKKCKDCPQCLSYSSLQEIPPSNSEEIIEGSQHQFKQRRQYFEDKFNRDRENDYDDFERKVLDSCNSLESSVNKYEHYLSRSDNRYAGRQMERSRIRSPTDYLQHLIRIRREVIKDYDTTDS